MAEPRNNKKVIRKAGRTIILRTNDEFTPKDLSGLLQHNNLQNGKHFLLFDSIENSKNAFKILKNNANLSVRFAYYRVFFTMNGISDNAEYSQLKKQHIEWLTQNSEAEVLYYKQYMKESKFIGCGDFTVDTKESMDKLLDKEGLKNYSFDGFTGTYYRYNKKNDKSQQEEQLLLVN
jgi:hypothetical protein